jgi:uncharacterized metal-binding protein
MPQDKLKCKICKSKMEVAGTTDASEMRRTNIVVYECTGCSNVKKEFH